MRLFLVLILVCAALVVVPSPAVADDCTLDTAVLPPHTPACWNRDPSITTPTGPAVTPRGRDVSYCATFTDPDGDQMWITFHWGGESLYILAASGFTWCPHHTWTTSGPRCVYASAHDAYHNLDGYWSPEIASACLDVIVGEAPLVPAEPVGATTVQLMPTPTAVCATSTDPDGDAIVYGFDFGDGATLRGPPVASGTTYCASHSYTATGTYCVRAYADDRILPIRGWSVCHFVSVHS